MTASEIETKYSSEKLKDFGFLPVGVIVLGDTTFLFQKNKETLFALEPVDPASQRDYFRSQTQRLNQKNYINIPGVDAVQVAYAQINAKSQIKANWIETTGGADKPEIEIPITDPIFFEDSVIELNEDVLRDLFLPKETKTKLATFFTMEMADQEVVGVAIRGNNPKLLFLPAAMEGSRLSTIAGLNNFLDSIYLRLMERTTQIQKQVDSAVFEASLPTKGKLVFSAEATKKTLAAVHRRIYQIQGLLISLRGDDKLGTQDPEILAHAPFLRIEGKQAGISALLSRTQSPVKVIVDGSIWSSLNEAPGAGLITTPTRASRPISAARPMVSAQRVEQRPAAVRPTTPEPVRQLTEKQKALLLAKEIDSGLNSVMTFLKDYTIDAISLKQVQEIGERLEQISKASEKYIAQRKRGKAPGNPTPTRISTPSSIINMAGIKDAAVFSFLTGPQTVTDYKNKIDSGFAELQALVLPLMTATSSRKERLLSVVKVTSHLLRLPNMPKMISELETIARSARVADLYTAEASFTLIATQISYMLWARYQELKTSGSEIEIDNWANYCYNVTDRMKTISKEIVSK